MTKNIIILLLVVCGSVATTVAILPYLDNEPDAQITQILPKTQQSINQQPAIIVAQSPIQHKNPCDNTHNGCYKHKAHSRLNIHGSPDRF